MNNSAQFQTGRLRRDALALALAGATLGFTLPAMAESTLTIVPYGDLRITDPYKGTGSSVMHAQMIFDTLFSTDAVGDPQPQMVGDYSISDDGKVYTFTLRDGLRFSDGEPVNSEDVIASVKRWAALASPGKSSPIDPEGYEAADETTFLVRLTQPFPLLPQALGSPFAPAFVMRAEDLDITNDEAIDTFVGSGPFLFAEAEWMPGATIVYLKNENYVPREEEASGYAGGHVVYFDRVVWNNIGDMQTALSALEAGEVDLIETLEGDDLTRGRAMENVAEAGSPDRGQQQMMVLNHTVPPFDTPEGRRAMLHLLNPKDILLAAAGDEDLIEICGSWYICGSRYAKPAGGEGLSEKPEPAKAKKLLEAAGYKGEPIVVLMATDRAANFNGSQVVVAELQALPELNVKSAIMDWGALTTRRASRELPANGGWSMFLTNGSTASQSDPLFHFNARMSCDKAWFGWPCDPETEQMRVEWASLPDEESRAKLAQELQERWAQSLPFIPFGTVANRTLYRADRITGVLDVPIRTPLWNIRPVD